MLSIIIHHMAFTFIIMPNPAKAIRPTSTLFLSPVRGRLTPSEARIVNYSAFSVRSPTLNVSKKVGFSSMITLPLPALYSDVDTIIPDSLEIIVGLRIIHRLPDLECKWKASRFRPLMKHNRNTTGKQCLYELERDN